MASADHDSEATTEADDDGGAGSVALSPRVIALTADAGVVTLAVISAAAASVSPLWGALLTLAAITAAAVRLLQLRRAAAPGWQPLGRAVVARAAAACAAAIALAESGRTSSSGLVAGIAAAILIGSIAIEPYVARATRFTVPLAARLPGISDRRSLPPIATPAVAASLVGTAAGPVLAAGGASPWWWVLAAALAVIPMAVLAADGRAKIVFARRRRAEVPAAVASYAPDFVVYTARPDDASYQVMMWLPYLKRAGRRFLVVVRNPEPAAALAALTDVPVVEARSMTDLDALVVPSLKAAFYVNASSGNGQLVRFQHLSHVYLGHGDSDKPPSYNPTHAMYDQIFAAGAAATRRYAAHGVRIPAEKFRIVGRPQVEDVRPAAQPIAEIAHPTVLYAPTWRGHVEETMLYSLPTGEQIVAALIARGATVIFRPHPFSYDFPDDAAVIARIQALLEADAAASGREHLWGPAAEKDRGILDCINASDAMVSDVSSVVSDYLFSGKPFAMIAVPSAPEQFIDEYPIAQASYVVRRDLADLDAQLAQMLGADPLAERRTAIRVDYLGDFPAAGYASAFVAAVQALSGKLAPDTDLDDPDEAGADEPAALSDGADRAPIAASRAAAPDPAADPNGAPDAAAEPTPAPAGAAAAPEADEDASASTRNWGGYLRILRAVGLDIAGAGLVLVAFAGALARWPGGLVVGLAVAGVVATFWTAWRRLRTYSSWPALLTRGQLTRTVLAFVLVGLATSSPGLQWPYALAAWLLAMAVAAEAEIRASWTAGLLVRNLPDAVPDSLERVPRGALPLAGTLVTLVGLVLAAASVLALPLVVGSLVVFVAAAVIGVVAITRAVAVEAAEHRLPMALRAYAPEFVVYFASTVGAYYQVGMWLPYFQRLERRFVIVTRTVPMFNQIDRLCAERQVEVPIIYRPTLRSVEEMVVPTMTTAFYVNNAPRNTHLVERRELTHVWLNHGDSEKPACFNPVHAIYDLIFAAGQAGIDRYARHGVQIPREKFQVVGRPQVEQIHRAQAPIAANPAPTVLYAPTWRGPFADSRVYSLPIGEQIVRRLLDNGATVVFRAHPFNYRYRDAVGFIERIGAMLDADSKATGRRHVWGPAAEQQMSVEDCFNTSDAMVSDVSAVVSDYLHSGKPFAMVSMGRSPAQLEEEAPAAAAAYVLREDLSNLDDVCEQLLRTDPLAGTRQQTRIYYLGDFDEERYADGFLTAARRVIDRA